MSKGFVTQCMVLLTDGRTTVDDLKAALREHDIDIAKQVPPGENWCFGGDTLIIPFLPKVNGYAALDVVNHPWPDSMGDPKSNPMLFAAWSMGHFGPFTFPASLERALQHGRAGKRAHSAAERHRGFIRIRMSYVFGCAENAPIMPKGCDPLAEMVFLSRIVLVVSNVPGVVCYFNPNGEVLYECENFHEIWDACEKQHSIPLPLWMNIRFFSLNEDFWFMDTVGNAQLDIRDAEAIFPKTKNEANEVDYYLRNVTHYLLEHEQAIKNGDSIDGPGETNLSWRLELQEEGLVAPPRRVVRMYPKASQQAIVNGLAAVGRSSI